VAEATTMTTEEKRIVTAAPRTAAGNPAPIDGVVQFSVTSGDCTIAPLEPADPMRTYVVSGATVGDSVVSIACDADLGSGVVPIQDTMIVHVTSPTATALVVSVGPPELK
jgi:hypothetical protein